MNTRIVTITKNAILPFVGYLTEQEQKMVGTRGYFALGAITDFDQGELASGVLTFMVENDAAVLLALASYDREEEILYALLREYTRVFKRTNLMETVIRLKDRYTSDIACGFLKDKKIPYFIDTSALKVWHDMTVSDIPDKFMEKRVYSDNIALLTELDSNEKKALHKYLVKEKNLLYPVTPDEAIDMADKNLSYVWMEDGSVKAMLLIKTDEDGISPLFYAADDGEIGMEVIAEAALKIKSSMPGDTVLHIYEVDLGHVNKE
jgi:hypothetical protein